MKKLKMINSLIDTKGKSLRLSFWILTLLVLIAGCNGDIVDDQSYYTFTGDRLGEYLSENEQFSEFYKMVDTTNVVSLLNSYGAYTCFAPNNDAVGEFYDSLGIVSMNELTEEEILKIVYDHIINGVTVSSEDFVEGRLPELTMSKRYISTTFSNFNLGDPVIKVNHTSPIVNANIEVHNGIIHEIGEVLKPTELNVVEALEQEPEFSLFYEALVSTGLDEELTLIEDLSYNKDDYENELDGEVRLGTLMLVPEYRKYGYTVLAESDSTYRRNGIRNLEELKAYAASVYDVIYPEDASITDITNRRNSLNRFVAYHLINKQLGHTKFIMDYDENTYQSNQVFNMFEYIETMCPNTLMEVRTLRSANRTNLFNYIPATGRYVTLDDENYDNDAVNGVYHEITDILTYNYDVASMISSKRLRMDAASFFPELTNNNWRGRAVESKLRYLIPPGYIERLKIDDGTDLHYMSNDDRLGDYQGDEFNSILGLYSFSLITLPIPKGTYEVRMGYQPTTSRGAAQLYWDGVPCGIPLDLSLEANNPAVGYILPGTDPTDPFGYENDKMMRNRGYMKGPSSFRLGSWYTAESARLSNNYLRRILGIYTFEKDTTHTFRVVASRSGQFVIDFLEFVPTEIIESEGID